MWGMTDFEFPRSGLSLVDNKLVPVGITKLRHPTNRRLHFLHVERNTALFQFRNARVNVVHFKSNRRPIARWLPGRMATNTNSGWAEIVLDPSSVHLRSRRL